MRRRRQAAGRALGRWREGRTDRPGMNYRPSPSLAPQATPHHHTRTPTPPRLKSGRSSSTPLVALALGSVKYIYRPPPLRVRVVISSLCFGGGKNLLLISTVCRHHRTSPGSLEEATPEYKITPFQRVVLNKTYIFCTCRVHCYVCSQEHDTVVGLSCVPSL